MTYWLISANLNKYNHDGAFRKFGFVDWIQYGNYKIGDIVYVYCSLPDATIRYKTEVIEIDMKEENTFDDSEFWLVDKPVNSPQIKFCRLKLLTRTDCNDLSLERLKDHGLKNAPQKTMKVNGDLLEYIDSVFEKGRPMINENIDKNSVFGGFQSWLTTKHNPRYTGREAYYGYSGYLKKLVSFMFKNGIIESDDLNSLDVKQYESYLEAYSESEEAQKYDKEKISTNGGRAALKLYIEYISYLLHPSIELPSFEYENCIEGGVNYVVYGTPGCGKSHYVDHYILGKDDNDEYIGEYKSDHIIRTTFYQDYSYTDFVGQIMPVIEYSDEVPSIAYRFKPGPFTEALECAFANPSKKVALVIEELNRGNAPSIFGDLFQLLDRIEEKGKDYPIGTSEYDITNAQLVPYLKDNIIDKRYHYVYDLDTIRLPANLSLFATMNTTDQNVFTLDTAFKRRWEFYKLNNGFSNHKYKTHLVPGMSNVTWESFVKSINSFIVQDGDQLSAEDKQIGVYFVSPKYLLNPSELEGYSDEDIKEIKERFAYKILEYLWDDVAKFSRDRWFGNIKTLDELIHAYVSSDDGKKVFVNVKFD